MAGDWIKFECNLPEKPEVLAITASLGLDDPDATVGKLMRLFRWFDQHTTDGNAARVTPPLLDRAIGVTGLTQALMEVGWLHHEPTGLRLEKFERHNGSSAKARAQTAKRVANHRSNAPGNAGSNAPTVTPALAREEKRREEKKNTEPNGSVERASRKCPESFLLTDDMRQWASVECPGVNVERETDRMRDHTFKTARSNWPGVWRNWMREAFDRLPNKRSGSAPQQSFAERDREAGMQRWEEMTGRVHPDRQQSEGVVIDMPTHQLAIGGRS
jgi:hypothetical protein